MKKLFAKGLVLILFIGILGWAPTAFCYPISYTSSEYRAYANDTIHSSEDIQLSPPVVALFDPFNVWGAYAYGDANSAQIYADSSYRNDAVGNVKIILTFTSTFPAIRIQYDYSFHAMAFWNDSNQGWGYGIGEINCYLKDTSSGVIIWSDDQIAEANVHDQWEVYNSGSVDKLSYLVPGDDYELNLSCSALAYYYFSDTAFVDVSLRNFQLNAVPPPPTVWLVGSGLLSLAGWRRFRKG
jgi:hypothetical protein